MENDPEPGPGSGGGGGRGHRVAFWGSIIGLISAVITGVVPFIVSRSDDNGPSTNPIVVVPGSGTDGDGSGDGGSDGGDEGSGSDGSDGGTDAATDPGDEPGTRLTGAEQALAKKVTTGDLHDCSSADPGGYAAVALACESTDGLEKLPLVLSFDTADDMELWMAGETSAASGSGSGCEAQEDGSGPWTYHDVETGTLACHWERGLFRIAWSFDDQLVTAVAEDSDAAVLMDWWKHDPLNLCGCAT
ncbi:hypothetical protein [Streptomyces sp. NPDC059786]|uniref:hypothetical protein n=1 Tax=Streptomyces sp. NPDC059786 TaxID=3346946 RepID=UPI00364FD845